MHKGEAATIGFRFGALSRGEHHDRPCGIFGIGLPTNWFVVAFLILVAMLLNLDEGTRVVLYVAPFWFILLGIGYQIAKRRAAQAA